MSDLRDQAVEAGAETIFDALSGIWPDEMARRTGSGLCWGKLVAVAAYEAAEPFLRAQVIAESSRMLFRRAEENRSSETTYEMAVKDAGAYLLWKLGQDA